MDDALHRNAEAPLSPDELERMHAWWRAANGIVNLAAGWLAGWDGVA